VAPAPKQTTAAQGTPAPWLTEAQTSAPSGSGAKGTAVQPPLIVPATQSPWDEPAAEPATVAWVPPSTVQGPTDTPWDSREPYRSEIEIVKPPDELAREVAPSGVICSACGTENESTRRFCKSCGNPLFAMDTTPQQVEEEPQKRSWRWLLILIPILVGALVLGFIGAALLRGGLPFVGGASPTPGAPPSAGTVAPSGQPSVPVTGQVKPSAASASSQLGDRWSASKAIDGRFDTSWQEGSKTEAGQWIRFAFKSPVTITNITIFAGSQTAEANYFGNLRPRHITIAADGGTGQKFELSDTFGPQDIAYTGPVSKTLQITINDTYPSKKTSLDGSPFDDCAISEVRFFGSTP